MDPLSLALGAKSLERLPSPPHLLAGLSTALAPWLLTGLTVRVTVLAGFAVLAVASLGLLLVTATTSLWLIALDRR